LCLTTARNCFREFHTCWTWTILYRTLLALVHRKCFFPKYKNQKYWL
jgi:hypothetical protein